MVLRIYGPNLTGRDWTMSLAHAAMSAAVPWYSDNSGVLRIRWRERDGPYHPPPSILPPPLEIGAEPEQEPEHAFEFTERDYPPYWDTPGEFDKDESTGYPEPDEESSSSNGPYFDPDGETVGPYTFHQCFHEHVGSWCEMCQMRINPESFIRHMDSQRHRRPASELLAEYPMLDPNAEPTGRDRYM